MKPKNKKNNLVLVKFASLTFLVLFVFTFKFSVKADEFDDRIDEYCETHSEEECENFEETVDSDESTYDSLENQKKNTKKLLKLKKQQSQTLQNQVNILNLEIGGVQGNIKSLDDDISLTQEKIDQIKNNISLKEKRIDESKKNLAGMIRGYYRLRQELGLSLISENGDIGKIFTKSDNLSQVSTQISNTLKIVKQEKETLGQNREEQEIEKGKLAVEKSKLDQEKKILNSKKSEKSSLLNRTKGEEATYQALIGKIESQMKQLLIDVSSLSDEEKGELDDILKDAKKPKYGTASTKWYYYQTDKDWANEKLGGSRYTIGDSGCAITSIAMVFTYHDEKVDPEDLADVSSFTSQGYIDWHSPPKKFDMKLEYDKYGIYHGNIDWDDVENLIEKDNPVIVYINAGSGGHYVVVHGYDKKNDDFVVHDPYWGPNLLLGTSRALVKKLHGRSTKVDQMIVYKPE